MSRRPQSRRSHHPLSLGGATRVHVSSTRGKLLNISWFPIDQSAYRNNHGFNLTTNFGNGMYGIMWDEMERNCECHS